MIRAVLDTNVIYAGLRSYTGASRRWLESVFSGQVTMPVSVPLFLEYEDVLLRQSRRLTPNPQDIDDFLGMLAAFVEPVEISYLWRPQLRDPKDDMVLEAAVNGRADMLVTHNIRDFRAAGKFSFEIVTPADGLNRLRNHLRGSS
ncbi:hypothetical protein MIN45_PP23 (plasmid) [Methylomarinovum tepidoasis]|uniref:PIN domain-containing protein n=1 Tax=Methylomarinovum tepidoasis TaxID=2840183 RepID=A0AAU9D4X0_9GAMM|nr:putative toxin-antitoxin system toxin component, PIN family [Methylomarinovum sp. IN45]BCX90009.1 hypothetical protein MIN45_PP23 [Methylomarinovum sp. IN45]